MRKSEKTCPACSTTLVDGKLEGVPLLVCQRCQGMLIQMEHFVSVIEAARAREEPSGTIPPRRAVAWRSRDRLSACAQAMLSHFYGGPGNLVIDTCERLPSELARSG